MTISVMNGQIEHLNKEHYPLLMLAGRNIKSFVAPALHMAKQVSFTNGLSKAKLATHQNEAVMGPEGAEGDVDLLTPPH